MFKHMYCLCFLVDILHGLLVLSKVFQYKHVDVKVEITLICLLFITEFTNLNVSTFNE